MALTLTLPPKIEALLRQRAESTGQDITSLALAVLAFGLNLDESDFFEALNLKLIQVASIPKRRQRGSAKGQIWMAADFDEPLEDFKEYME
jgi:Protein of unknown function (DUF2281)